MCEIYAEVSSEFNVGPGGIFASELVGSSKSINK